MNTSKLLLSGCAGADPTIITTSKGTKMAKLRLAVSEKQFNEVTREIEIKTSWHNIIFWDDLADLAERHISKGTRLTLGGYVRHRDWIDKEGRTRTTTEVHASEFKIITRQGYAEQDTPENF